ncbi:MAG: ankyrin repeat domain-containing protein [Bacteroidetes bacterium]|nr:ankyrin repeat domain-containing protein [Bacteroidota bacterium]
MKTLIPAVMAIFFLLPGTTLSQVAYDPDKDYAYAEILRMMDQGLDINQQLTYGTVFHSIAHSFGFSGDTTHLDSILMIVSKAGHIKDPLWFLEDPYSETKKHLFYYISRLIAKGNEISIDTLKLVIDLIYYRPCEGCDRKYFDFINYQDQFGKTPLMYACELDKPALIIHILNKGGKRNIRDKKGMKAIDFCLTENARRALLKKKLCDCP